MGGKMSPSAVLVIHDGITRLVNVKNQDTVSKIIDMVPDIIEKFRKKDAHFYCTSTSPLPAAVSSDIPASFYRLLLPRTDSRSPRYSRFQLLFRLAVPTLFSPLPVPYG